MARQRQTGAKQQKMNNRREARMITVGKQKAEKIRMECEEQNKMTKKQTRRGRRGRKMQQNRMMKKMKRKRNKAEKEKEEPKGKTVG